MANRPILFAIAIACCLIISIAPLIQGKSLPNNISSTQFPDTLGGSEGWRYATFEDNQFWESVSEGDVIIFQGASIPNRIDSRQYDDPIILAKGSKLFIWRGNYERIYLDGNSGMVTSTIASEPLIITNLGGQVKWGESYRQDQYRGFEIYNIDHLFISGEYNLNLGTGHPDYLGLQGDLSSTNWIENFGMVGDQKYTSFTHGVGGHGFGLKVTSFKSVKIRGLATIRGFFSGFHIKNELQDTRNTAIDIQDCLAGWTKGEGFYLGYNGSQDADMVSHNKVTFNNNVVLFTGAEGLQIDFMSKGSEVKNNFVFKTGCFYQVPFQGGHLQENGIQWSFVEGNISIEDNIFFTANAGNILVGPRYKYSASKTLNNGIVSLSNNLLGPSLRSVGFIFPGDDEGKLQYRINNNVIDSIAVPDANDAYVFSKNEESAFINSGNSTNPIFLENNIFPEGKSLVVTTLGDGSNLISDKGSKQQKAPELLLHKNFGFEPREMLKFRGIWLTGKYNDQVENFGAISYFKGDMVFMIEKNKTEYFRCIKDHASVKKPSLESTFWEKMTWNGFEEPAFTPLIQPNSYYNFRGMGLYSNPVNTMPIDTTAPQIIAEDVYNFWTEGVFTAPEFKAVDNNDGDITNQMSVKWIDGVPETNELGQPVYSGLYTVELNISDVAGNRAETKTVLVNINENDAEVVSKTQINLHRFHRANLLTEDDYWTDIAENKEGLKNNATTYSIVKDTSGNALNWTLQIIDGLGDTYSKHYGSITNFSASALGPFPAEVMQTGLRLRKGIEEDCFLNFLNLDPNHYYDFYFTGSIEGSGVLNVSVEDTVSKQKSEFNLMNNQEVFTLSNIKPLSSGTISLLHRLGSTIGQDNKVTSVLSGLIVIEKSGFGPIDHDLTPPGDIMLSSNVILPDAQNSPVGYLSSENEAEVFYELVDGNGSTDNSSFLLTDSALVFTGSVFKEEYSIRVRAFNEIGLQEEVFSLLSDTVFSSVPVINNSTVQIHLTHERFYFGGNPGMQDYWNVLSVNNSNRDYTLSDIRKSNGTETPLRISVTKSSTEGFNYSNGLNEGVSNHNTTLNTDVQQFFVCTTNGASVRLEGLDTAKTYNIKTFSNGRKIWNGQNRRVSITINGELQRSNFSPKGGNLQSMLEWQSLSPDKQGEVVIEVTGHNQPYGVLNAIIIREENQNFENTELAGLGSDFNIDHASLKSLNENEADVNEEVNERTLLKEMGFELYPVPVINNKLNFKYPVELEDKIAFIKIYDSTGRQYQVSRSEEYYNGYIFNTTGLLGYYILEIEDTEGVKYKFPFTVF